MVRGVESEQPEERPSRGTVTLDVGPDALWVAEMTWYDGDHHGPSVLTLKPKDPDNVPAGGISQTVLRAVDMRKAIADATDFMRRIDEETTGLPPINWDTVGPLLTELSADGLSDTYLAALAWAYSAAANSPKPLERLAELTGKSFSAIRSHLWQAKRNGLLERTPGRKGGAVTTKAIELLSQLVDELNASA